MTVIRNLTNDFQQRITTLAMARYCRKNHPFSYTIGPNTINTMWAAPTVWGETWRVLSAVATIMGAGVDGIYDDVTSQRNNTVKMITFIQL